ncbi:sugar phosphate isomerase/epimerase family protein [Edaphobacter modestus]|uniref:Sugar phosphate isomerase/epimerase n=1 Tax=Edaphobacter modestus TaxID=388466 RepID=A0A4Q7Z031_9BACT|nr:sugar phosphate isomerase/epimerase family protein [Edaphobacter modestus]RZU42911.1 sugar phosphate isomerase/epimerase [Edaphobacter modestus]
MEGISRRGFLRGSAAVGVGGFAGRAFGFAGAGPFKVGVITDEISQDFDHACAVASKEFGMQWVELRAMWKKSLLALTDAELAETQKILSKYNLQVTDIASPLFKAYWPGAPQSSEGPKGGTRGGDVLKEQDEVLEKSIALAKQFKTNKVRCFDFWRIEDVKPYRDAIDRKLAEAADKCAKHGVLLVLENEPACNTATGRESARLLGAVKSPHLALNWDPGNAVMRGEFDAYPVAWRMLPKERIHHCHVKNAVKGSEGKVVWSPTGEGIIDWTAQFRDLAKVGYRDAVSLETHWHGGGTPEQSTRVSWSGMKKALQDSGNL